MEEQSTEFQLMYKKHREDSTKKLDALIASLLQAKVSNNNDKFRALTTIVEERTKK